MFLLGGSTFPQSGEDFRVALEQGMNIFGLSSGVVQMGEGMYPYLNDLKFDLTGGRLSNELRPTEGVGDMQTGIQTDHLEIIGSPVYYEKCPVNIHLIADHAQLDFDRDKQGRPLVALTCARNGKVEVQLLLKDLERLIFSIAQSAAKKHGVTIERVRLTLNSYGPHSLGFQAEITIRKFMSAVIDLAGRVEIDNHLDAKISGLFCKGEGMVASLACNFLQPILERFNGRQVPLMAFPFGDIKLHDLQAEITDSLRIKAEFTA